MKLKAFLPAALVAMTAAALPASALAVSGPVAEASATRTILVRDNFFSPKSVTVPRNTTLKFVWRGRLVHNVASGRRILISNRTKGTGALRVSRSVTLNCTLHRGMNLRVNVR
ncbi:MAG: hypothetical protein FGM34_04990 [Solirubrobacteraceae bacterium]|nr:hypothetical protein [Solirubrobacteraceae bacterium]